MPDQQWIGSSIDKGIEEMISSCNACQKYRNLNPREPLLSHEIPKDVWNKLATDVSVCLNKLYLIVIDTPASASN